MANQEPFKVYLTDFRAGSDELTKHKSLGGDPGSCTEERGNISCAISVFSLYFPGDTGRRTASVLYLP